MGRLEDLLMNRCPRCQEPVLDLAVTCRHCGSPIDEKTLCLSEDAILEEIRAAKVAAESAASHKRVGRVALRMGQGLVVAGLGIAAVGLGPYLPWWSGLLLAGAGLGMIAILRWRVTRG